MAKELLLKLLKQTDDEHIKFVKKEEEANRYYQNENSIIKTGAAYVDAVNNFLSHIGKNPLKSADNRIPTNWHRLFTDQKVAYLFSYPPQFDTDESANNNQMLDQIKEALGGRYEKVVKQLGVDATNTGVGWLAYWYSETDGKRGDFRYYFVPPGQIRAIYSEETLEPVLQYVIREYTVIGEDGKEIKRLELWDDKHVEYYTRGKREMIEDGRQSHTYGRVPFIPFYNNSTQTGDLGMYKQLVDAIDKLISGFVNDIDDIQEIIWVLKNYTGETSDYTYDVKTGEKVEKTIDLLQTIKAKKWVSVDDNGGLEAVRGEIPHEARSVCMELLRKQLYISAMAVDPNPEQTGNATGTYIEFLYGLLELKAGLMETEFRAGFDEFIRAILRYLGEDEKTQIEQKWIRNKPRNALETVQMIAQTPETVLSDETKTKEHPLTEDWKVERDRIEKALQEKYHDLMDSMAELPKAVDEGEDE